MSTLKISIVCASDDDLLEHLQHRRERHEPVYIDGYLNSFIEVPKFVAVTWSLVGSLRFIYWLKLEANKWIRLETILVDKLHWSIQDLLELLNNSFDEEKVPTISLGVGIAFLLGLSADSFATKVEIIRDESGTNGDFSRWVNHLKQKLSGEVRPIIQIPMPLLQLIAA